jgi:hypothetical protein
MNRYEFDQIVDETTDRVLDKLSEGFFAHPSAEEERQRMVVRSAVRDGFLNLLSAHIQKPAQPVRTPVPSR